MNPMSNCTLEHFEKFRGQFVLFVLSLTKCQCHMDYWCSISFIEQEGRKHTKNHAYYVQTFLGMYIRNILWTTRSIHDWCESYNMPRENTHMVTTFANMTKYSMPNIDWSKYKHEQVVFLHIVDFLCQWFLANPTIYFLGPFWLHKNYTTKMPPQWGRMGHAIRNLHNFTLYTWLIFSDLNLKFSMNLKEWHST